MFIEKSQITDIARKNKGTQALAFTALIYSNEKNSRFRFKNVNTSHFARRNLAHAFVGVVARASDVSSVGPLAIITE